jgi:hypothetical protein
MLKRLIVGLVIGVLVGGLIGYGLFQVLPTAMAGALGYAFAAVTGVLVGLVAGKPIWAREAAVEAGLKAFVGALLAMGVLFGIRFLGLTIPSIAEIPAAEIGRHPIGSLAAIAVLLSVFYELDNTGGDEPAPKARVEGDKARVATNGTEEMLEEEEVPAAKKSGKR